MSEAIPAGKPGNNQSGPFLDVATMASTKLRTFREYVEAGEMPPGYRGLIDSIQLDQGQYVIYTQPKLYAWEYKYLDLARLMGDLDWREQQLLPA